MRKIQQAPRLPLNIELEKAALCAIIDKDVSIDKVHLDELSKEGQYVYKAIKEFDASADCSYKSIYLHATEALGADPEAFKVYIKAVEKAEVPQVGKILDLLARKAIITDLVNEAAAQVSGGNYSLLGLKSMLAQHGHERNTLVPMSEEMSEAAPPEGMKLPGLEAINRHLGGLFGMWVVSGMPAAGKSTLALMISMLTSALHRPVLYYDFEQGKSVLRWHIHQALKGDGKKIKSATNRLYVRHSLALLERDLEMVGEPALVVVDSIQKVAKGLTFRRESLENWVHKLEGLKEFGHHLLLVSEKNRASYGEPTMSGYKETGEIEYAADAALDLMLPNEQDSSTVDVHVVKNRHYKFLGHLTTLTRENSYWFRDTKSARNVREVD